MPSGRIVVIGDEDAVFGLGLLGFQGKAVSDIEGARQALHEAVADPSTALILLTENWADARFQAALTEGASFVVEIPCFRPVARVVGLQEQIQRALGVRLED